MQGTCHVVDPEALNDLSGELPLQRGHELRDVLLRVEEVCRDADAVQPVRRHSLELDPVRVAPDKPQWRVNLEIRRGASTEASDQFVFSFLDGQRSATIQTVAGSERMGSGTVRVTRHGTGARFDVEGKSKEGAPVHATIDCSAFQKSEAAGG
jgi:hypothetical protein